MRLPHLVFASFCSVIAILIMVRPTVAESAFDLWRQDYQIIWSGYAKIDKCRNEEDVHNVGPYLFVCDAGTHEYPYHYGDTIIAGRSMNYNGKDYWITYVCMEREDECLKGTLYRR